MGASAVASAIREEHNLAALHTFHRYQILISSIHIKMKHRKYKTKLNVVPWLYLRQSKNSAGSTADVQRSEPTEEAKRQGRWGCEGALRVTISSAVLFPEP